MTRNQKGFTLIELLVTMTIIAVLAALALVALQGSRQSARDARRRADLEEIRAALEMCRADTGSYVNDIYTVNVAGTIYLRCGSVNYLATPYDPSGGAVRYYYLYTPATLSYVLCARLEGGNNANLCGAHNCGGQNCNYRVTQP